MEVNLGLPGRCCGREPHVNDVGGAALDADRQVDYDGVVPERTRRPRAQAIGAAGGTREAQHRKAAQAAEIDDNAREGSSSGPRVRSGLLESLRCSPRDRRGAARNQVWVETGPDQEAR